MRHRDAADCDCDECWEIRRLAVRRYRASFTYETGEPIKPIGGPARDADHGTMSRFNWGCKCQECRDCSNDYRRAMAARKREAVRRGL